MQFLVLVFALVIVRKTGLIHEQCHGRGQQQEWVNGEVADANLMKGVLRAEIAKKTQSKASCSGLPANRVILTARAWDIAEGPGTLLTTSILIMKNLSTADGCVPQRLEKDPERGNVRRCGLVHGRLALGSAKGGAELGGRAGSHRGPTPKQDPEQWYSYGAK